MTGENRRTRTKICFITNLSATNPSSTNQGMTFGFRGEEPRTNRFNCGTSVIIHTKRQKIKIQNKDMQNREDAPYNLRECHIAGLKNFFQYYVTECLPQMPCGCCGAERQQEARILSLPARNFVVLSPQLMWIKYKRVCSQKQYIKKKCTSTTTCSAFRQIRKLSELECCQSPQFSSYSEQWAVQLWNA